MKLPTLTAPPGALVDIIIRAKNGHELTGACVRSIRASTARDTYRLILVDDGSQESIYDIHEDEQPYDPDQLDLYVRSNANRGAVTATNMGLGISFALPDSQYVLILDNDTLIPDGDHGWLSRMIAELEQGGPQTACVGATTNFANPPQHILTAPATYTHNWSDEKAQRGGVKENPAVPAFVSFAVLFRKDVLRRVGLWDDRYNPGNYEDTDYSVALRTLGYEIRVARSVYIHHVGHQTFREDLQTLLQTNGEKFYDKWGVGKLFDMGFVSPEQLKAAL